MDGRIALALNQNKSVPLPVTLLEFTGAWFNDDAVLAWKTGVETDLDHFELDGAKMRTNLQ